MRQRVAIEYDGLAVHGTQEAFFRDRARDADFQFAHWLVFRLTGRTLYSASPRTAFLADLRRCLDARRIP